MSNTFFKKQKKIALLFTLLFNIYTLPSLANTEVEEKPNEVKKQNKIIEDSVGFNFNLDVGRYIWRGIPLSDGKVITPSTSISFSNFELASNAYLFLNKEDFWGSIKLVPAQYKIPEIDFSLSYNDFSLWNLSIKPYTELYCYPLGSDPLTGSVGLEVTYPLWFINFDSNISIIYMGFTGVYYGDIGFSYENTFLDNFTVSGAIKLDITSKEFNNRFMDVNKATISAFESALSLSYKINDFYIKPHIEFSSIIDKDLRVEETSNSNEPENNVVKSFNDFDIFNFGISIGYNY